MQPQIFGLSFLALKNRYFAQGISFHDFQTATFLESLSREHKPTKFLWLRLRGCERRYHKKNCCFRQAKLCWHHNQIRSLTQASATSAFPPIFGTGVNFQNCQIQREKE